MAFEIGEGCNIHPSALIHVKDGYLGPRSILRKGVIIEGNNVQIGAESYFDIRARIGGGSCFDKGSALYTGDFFHMGVDSHVNTARTVMIGHEVGVGVGTKIFTHGAYLPADMGFPVQWGPVQIGDRVWLPNAWVNPGVTIGSNVVVAANSLVNKDLPDGCLAGGIPAKVIKENVYPQEIRGEWLKKFLEAILAFTDTRQEKCVFEVSDTGVITIDGITYFDIPNRTITGAVTTCTKDVKNQLRRNGIRFRYYAQEGEYVPW